MANTGHPLRIWSFDAGGPGVISGQIIVEEIMRRLGNDAKENPGDPPLPCDHADIMVGTQLGAVAALLLGRLRLAPAEVMDSIGMIGDEVFAPQTPNKMISDRPVISDAPEHMPSLSSLDSSMGITTTSPTPNNGPPKRVVSYNSSSARISSISMSPFTPTGSLDTSKSTSLAFSTEKLREVVVKVLKKYGYDGDTKLIGDLPKDQCQVAVVCALADDTEEVTLLCNYPKEPNRGHNYTIVDAILATMATPKWFDPVMIGSGDNVQKVIGGCMKSYNPINEALKETRNLYEKYLVCSIISIGSGRHEAHRLQQSTKEEFSHTLNHMMLDCNNTANAVGRDFARQSRHRTIYQRLSVAEEMTHIPITDWSDERFDDIRAQTDTYLDNPETKAAITMAVRNLKGRAGYVLPTVEALTSSFTAQMAYGAPPSYSRVWQEPGIGE